MTPNILLSTCPSVSEDSLHYTGFFDTNYEPSDVPPNNTKSKDTGGPFIATGLPSVHAFDEDFPFTAECHEGIHSAAAFPMYGVRLVVSMGDASGTKQYTVEADVGDYVREC